MISPTDLFHPSALPIYFTSAQSADLPNHRYFTEIYTFTLSTVYAWLFAHVV